MIKLDKLEHAALKMMGIKPRKRHAAKTKVGITSRPSKSRLMNIHQQLERGELIHYSTYYIESLKFYFDEFTGQDLKYELISPRIYKLSL